MGTGQLCSTTYQRASLPHPNNDYICSHVFSKFDMDTQDPINEHKYISENPSSKNEFLTEKQRILIEYHFAVKRSLGFTESEHGEPSDPTALRRNSETEVPADK